MDHVKRVWGRFKVSKVSVGQAAEIAEPCRDALKFRKSFDHRSAGLSHRSNGASGMTDHHEAVLARRFADALCSRHFAAVERA